MGIPWVLWRLVRLALIVGILIGAWRNLSGFDSAGSLVNWFSQNWMALAIVWIFLNSIAIRSATSVLETTSEYTRLFIASMLEYLQFTPRVPAQDEIEARGLWSAWRANFSVSLLTLLLFGPMEDDQCLRAKPVREGSQAALAGDIEAALGRQTS